PFLDGDVPGNVCAVGLGVTPNWPWLIARSPAAAPGDVGDAGDIAGTGVPCVGRRSGRGVLPRSWVPLPKSGPVGLRGLEGSEAATIAGADANPLAGSSAAVSESMNSFAEPYRFAASRLAAFVHHASKPGGTVATSDGTGTGATMIFMRRSP